MVPNALLKELFEELGHGDFDPHWDELKKQEIDPILAYLDELPGDQLNEIESVLRSVFELAAAPHGSGFDSILEAGRLFGVDDLAAMAPGDHCVYGLATWAWLHHRAIFEKGQIIHQVVHLSYWRKRNDLPANEPDMSPEAREKLERDVSMLLKSQGRGKDCTVETMSRGDVDYFFAYPDDFVQNVTVHDENHRLTVEAFRQTLMIVFAYNREDGSLELFAKLAKPVKERLEVIFAKAILHWDLNPHEPDAAYELNQLKDVWFDLTPDAEDCLRVHIRKMRLSAKYSGHRVLVEIDEGDPDDDIHKAIRKCVNLEEVPLSEWNVTQVTFCFEFLPLAARKPGKHSFDVTFPRSCSLRNARPERVELIQKYLKRWKIDRVGTAEPSAVAVGA
jgi:hypothetical protein